MTRFPGLIEAALTSALCYITFSPCLYRSRNLVERFFNKIKQCRRSAARYDEFAANYFAFIKLASLPPWLRAYEFTPSLSILALRDAPPPPGGPPPRPGAGRL